MKKIICRHPDRLLACLVAILVLLAGLSTLDYDFTWGDDSAGYLNQAMSLVNGNVDEQVKLNAFLHPSRLPEEVQDGTLVYPWGYPLVLALVMGLFGFDRFGIRWPLLYTVPSVIALTLSAAVFFLWCRRRFSRIPSVLLSLSFCLHPSVWENLDLLYTDQIFLLFALLTVYLADSYTDRLDKCTRNRFLPGIGLGVACWLTIATRLNGTTVAALALLLHLNSLRKSLPRGKEWLYHLLPYAVALVLCLLQRLALPGVTSNLSDVGKTDPAKILHTVVRYLKAFKAFLGETPGYELPHFLWNIMVYGLVAAWFFGMVRSIRHGKQFLPYAAYAVGTYVVVFLLPYYQGNRYIFLTLAIILLPFGYAMEGLSELLRRKTAPETHRVVITALTVCAALLVLNTAREDASDNLFRVLNGEDVRGQGAESTYASEMVGLYAYVRENTPEDAVIAFGKPRQMYLATGRMGFSMYSDNHAGETPDYFLQCRFLDDPEEIEALLRSIGRDYTPVYESENLVFYEIL